jgi:hypothetical protein
MTMALPPYSDSPIGPSPWDAVELHQTKEKVMSDDEHEKVILVVKLKWMEDLDSTAFVWAWRQQFLRFLQDKDRDGDFRRTLADELSELADHVRSGAIFRDD